MINFTIRNLTGSDCPVSFEATASFATVEAHLIEQGFLQTGTNRFIFAGKQLTPEMTISEATVVKNSVVHVVPLSNSTIEPSAPAKESTSGLLPLRPLATEEESSPEKTCFIVTYMANGLLSSQKGGSVTGGPAPFDETTTWTQVPCESGFKLRGLTGFLTVVGNTVKANAAEQDAAIWLPAPSSTPPRVLMRSNQGKLAILSNGRVKHPRHVGVGGYAQFSICETREEATAVLEKQREHFEAAAAAKPQDDRKAELEAARLAKQEERRAALEARRAAKEAARAERQAARQERTNQRAANNPPKANPSTEKKPDAGQGEAKAQAKPTAPKTHFIVPYCGKGTLRSNPDGSVSGGGGAGPAAMWVHEHEGDKYILKGRLGHIALSKDSVRCNASHEDASHFTIEKQSDGTVLFSCTEGRLGIMDDGTVKPPSRTGRGRHAKFSFQATAQEVAAAPKHKSSPVGAQAHVRIVSQIGAHGAVQRALHVDNVNHVHVKLFFKSEIHRFPLPSGAGVYERLVSVACEKHTLAPETVTFKYLDDEKDLVCLENDEDFRYASKLMKNRLNIEVTGQSAEESTENSEAAGSVSKFPQDFDQKFVHIQLPDGQFVSDDNGRVSVTAEPSMWQVLDTSEEGTFRLASSRGKYLRCLRKGVLDVKGGKGPWTIFQVSPLVHEEGLFEVNGFGIFNVISRQTKRVLSAGDISPAPIHAPLRISLA